MNMNVKVPLALILATFVVCAAPSVQAAAPGQAPPPVATSVAAPTTDQIDHMSSDDLKHITSDQIKALAPEEVTHLSAEQLQDLKPEQIGDFTVDQVKVLTPSQIGDLTSDQLKGLVQAQIQVLTSDQIHEITRYKIKALSSDQISYLSIEQIKELLPEQTKALSADQISKLKTDQVQALLLGAANTPNGLASTSTAVPLAEAHTLFANEFGKDKQDKSYPDGPQGVLFVTQNELDNSVESNNWARLRYGVATVVSQPIKGFILLQAPNRLQQVYVYVANSNSQVDLTKVPYKTALTPTMNQNHYGDLYPHFDKLRHFLGPMANSIYPLLGVSVNTVGDKQASKSSSTTFLVGAGTDLGPYAGFNAGLAVSSLDKKISTGLSVGFSLDTALLSKIFK